MKTKLLSLSLTAILTTPLSIAEFPAISALAILQSQTKFIQNQEVTSSQVSTNPITLPKTVKFNTAPRNSLPTTNFPTQPFLISGGGNVIYPEAINCNKPSDTMMLQTPEGIISVSDYCQTQFNNLQQLAANVQAPSPWQELYWSNGNVCRERGADRVCLTPQEATNIRWLKPSK